MIAAAAVMALGAGMKYFGEQKADKALYSTFSRERERQKGMTEEQIDRFEDSLESTRRVTDPGATAAAAAAREAYLKAAMRKAAPAAGGYQMPGSGSAPTIVATQADQAGARADAGTGALAQAIASLGGVDDQIFENNIAIGRNSGEIGQIGGFMRGSMDVLQSELEAAKQKGGTLRALGSLAQSIGGAMMSAGGAGGAPIGGGGAPPLPGWMFEELSVAPGSGAIQFAI